MELSLKHYVLVILLILKSAGSNLAEHSVPNLITSLVHQQNHADKSRNHQVTLIRLGSRNLEIFSDIVTEVLKNCPQNTVFVHDSLASMKPYQVHTSSIFVVVTDIQDPQRLFNVLLQLFNRNYWKNQAKFIFVPVNLPRRSTIFAVTENLGILNAIIVIADKKVEVFATNRFHRTSYLVPPQKHYLESLFPEQLNDMNRYRYEIYVFSQPPKVQVTVDKVDGIELQIFRVIAEKKNATLNMFVIPTSKAKEIIFAGLRRRTFDLTLNTGIFEKSLGIYFRSVYTYDMDGYCAVVPYPARLTFLHFLLNHFDVFTWIILVVAVSASAIIWMFLSKNQSSTSGFYFVFAIAANFVGQSLVLRSNHRTLTILIQICIFMTFILGNAYQSLIISSMTSAREGNRIKTFEELFSSDFKLLVDPVFYRILDDSGDFSTVMKRMEKGEGTPNYPGLAAKNYALILQCKLLFYEYNGQMDAEIAEYFYVLPDRMTNIYEKIYLSVNSPFYDDLQRKYLLMFESGIRQHWEKWFEYRQTSKHRRELNFLQNEEFLLRLFDVYGVFVIMGVAFAISCSIFLIEISWLPALKLARFLYRWKRRNRWLKKIFKRKR